MKSFVVQTYFQIMRSVAFSLDLGEKTNLYVLSNYLNIDDDMIQKLLETGLFNEVVKIDYLKFQKPFILELEKTKKFDQKQIDQVGNSIFEKHLMPFFSKVFKNADHEDDIYVFNDAGWFYYYVEKEFENIIGVEDGYNALKQYIDLVGYRGKNEHVLPFVGKYYPDFRFKSPKVKKIISSCPEPEMDEYYRDLITVVDHFELADKNRKKYTEAITHIFGVEGLEIEPQSVLYLTSISSRGLYCTVIEDYLFNRKVIGEEASKGKHVYIKPHPAEKLNLNSFLDDNVTLLPQSMPVEILGYLDAKFEKGLSLGSSVMNVNSFIGENIKMLPKSNPSRDEVKSFIKGYIKDEVFNMHIYLKVDKIALDNYINIYSYAIKKKYLKETLYIMVPSGKAKEFKEYYDKKNLKSRIDEYLSKDKHCIWNKEIAGLETLVNDGKRVNVEFVEVDDFSEDGILSDHMIKNPVPDYFLLIDSDNNGFNIMRRIFKMFKKTVPDAISLAEYDYANEKKYYYLPEVVYRTISPRLENRLWFGRLIKDAIDKKDSSVERRNVINLISAEAKRPENLVSNSMPEVDYGLDDDLVAAQLVLKCVMEANNENMGDDFDGYDETLNLSLKDEEVPDELSRKFFTTYLDYYDYNLRHLQQTRTFIEREDINYDYKINNTMRKKGITDKVIRLQKFFKKKK